MFIGHFGVGFGGKAAAPRVSLGTLILAAQLVDLVWPTFLLLGIESVRLAPGITVVTPLDFHSYPWTHSLLMAVVWGAALGAAHFAFRRDMRSAAVLGTLVVSHWVLDFITHRPDLPLVPGGETKVGLGAWNSLPLTLTIEGLIFVGGVALYVHTTRAKDRTGHLALWSLVMFLVLMHGANLFGPPPPNVEAIAWAGHAQWLLVVWGYWIDRHRAAAA